MAREHRPVLWKAECAGSPPSYSRPFSFWVEKRMRKRIRKGNFTILLRRKASFVNSKRIFIISLMMIFHGKWRIKLSKNCCKFEKLWIFFENYKLSRKWKKRNYYWKIFLNYGRIEICRFWKWKKGIMCSI